MPAEAPAAKLHSATWLLVWPAVTVSGVMLHGRLVTCQVEQRAFETLDEWDAVAVRRLIWVWEEVVTLLDRSGQKLSCRV